MDEIVAYADASIRWEHPQLNQGKAAIVVAVCRELDAHCIVASIPSRGIGQFDIVRNAEIDAILMAKNLLESNFVITDSRFARDAIRNQLDVKIQWASRKDLRIRIVDFLSKSSHRGEGYIILNSSSPQRNWIQFVSY